MRWILKWVHEKDRQHRRDFGSQRNIAKMTSFQMSEMWRPFWTVKSGALCIGIISPCIGGCYILVEGGLPMFRPTISLPIIPDGFIHLYLGPINTTLPNISALPSLFWRFATGKFSLPFSLGQVLQSQCAHGRGILPWIRLFPKDLEIVRMVIFDRTSG